MISFGKNFYCISSRMENSGQLYGCFKIGPFYGHQSLTFANTLRRTLLADKSRCIFEAVQIQGVEHEFSSLLGVRESVIDIILNLEKIVFQINKPITKPQIAIINFQGPGILRAQHIHLPANINCLVPSQYIATLEIDGQLRIKLFFTPNWYKFQQFLQSNILNNEEKRFQKTQYPKFQIQKKFIKFNNKFSFLLSQLQKIFIHFKSSTFLRYLPFLKSQLLYNISKNNKINFREIAATVHSKKKNNLKTNSFQPIQENFLFLQTSLCAIEKVHYTIQSKSTTTAINERRILDAFSNKTYIKASKTQFKHQLRLNKMNKTLFLSQKFSETEKNESAKLNLTQSKVIGFNRPKPLLSANNEEFILFEVWTNGSIHPQKAIGNAINEILLDFFPYSFYINKTELKLKTSVSSFYVKKQTVKQPEIQRNQFKVINSNIQRKTITNISKKKFYEKFLNLEIGNFYFDLETHIYLKEKKIHRIVDFLNFFNNAIELKNSKKALNFYNLNKKTLDRDKSLSNSTVSILNTTAQIENTLLKFQTFITSFLDQ